MNRHYPFHWLTTLLATLAAVPSVAANDLPEALAVHQSAVAAVDSIHFKFSYHSELFGTYGRVHPSMTGEYWRSPTSQRLDYTHTQAAVIQSAWVLPDRVVVAGQTPDPTTSHPLFTASINPNVGFVPLLFSPWRDAMYALDSQKGIGTQRLSDHVREYFGSAKYESANEQSVITAASGRSVIRLDAKRNYLIRGKTSRLGEARVRGKPSAEAVREEVVQEFQEVGPGIYFPKRVVIEEKVGAELQNRRTVTFTDVKVNGVIAPSVFEPRHKPGTKVTDFVQSTVYQVGADGRPVGTVEPLKLLGGVQQSPEGVSEYTRPTADEGRPSGWWVIVAGMGLVFAGLLAAVWRRWRT